MSKRENRRIDSIIRKAERVIGASQPSVDSVYPISWEESWRWCGVTIATLSMVSYGVS